MFNNKYEGVEIKMGVKRRLSKKNSESKIISSPQRGSRYINLGNKGKSSGRTIAKVRDLKRK